jgi:hypothetical protein
MRDAFARFTTYLTVGTALFLIFVKSKSTAGIIHSSGVAVSQVESSVEGNVQPVKIS